MGEKLCELWRPAMRFEFGGGFRIVEHRNFAAFPTEIAWAHQRPWSCTGYVGKISECVVMCKRQAYRGHR